MKATNEKPNTTYLKDYRQSDFLIESIDLHVELGEEKTRIYTVLKVVRNSRLGKHDRSLVLEGEELTLISLQVDKKTLQPFEYQVTPKQLTIPKVPDFFTLEIINEIYPQNNTELSGLYRSKDLFCTQCEAQGFRRITYYLDRPDVMAPFTTTIVADKTRYPVLLSNGNRVKQGEMDNNRHYVKWEDPFKKPCYLFALVAGPLSKISDQYITQSGRKVLLEIFVEPENIQKCDYAMGVLKRAMQWDEKTYGREYDLDNYMIVAVNDFNMGAMENKGLNIFNAKYVLADEKSATDQDFQNVESVIGHEYFHNWTGNRITCRDWFQLSLKEGLTVFREQQFSEDMGSPVVKRIAEVRNIRTRQFAEDSGPMAHPVQPDSYMEINNFYTSTIYSKGAEVIRMLRTILGKEGFRAGMDLYFTRHDGHAVTIDDFLASFADANDKDLNQFHRWYKQAGTPQVIGEGKYDPSSKKFILTLSQTCPSTPDKKEKKPFVIPIEIELYDENGQTLPLKNKELISHPDGKYIVLNTEKVKFEFADVPTDPIPSLLGSFSAPVKLSYPYKPADLVVLAKHDKDLFNRWDAMQRIASSAIMQLMQDYKNKKSLKTPDNLFEIYEHLLNQKMEDPALYAQLLSIPSFLYIAEELPKVEVDALNAARRTLINQLAEKNVNGFMNVYHQAAEADDGQFSNESMQQRALKNHCLYYLSRNNQEAGLSLAKRQFDNARNMTDLIGALSAVNDSTQDIRNSLLNDFYQKWQNQPLVVNKWLALQAVSDRPEVLDHIKSLTKHKAYDIGNPNKVYALIGSFCHSNPERFHDEKGEGYHFAAEQIIALNARNPQVATRVLESLTGWKRLDEKHGELMKQALLKIQDAGNLSEDVYEVVTKSLEG